MTTFSDYGMTTPRKKPKMWRAKGPAIPAVQRYKYDIALKIGCECRDLTEEEGIMFLDGVAVAILSQRRMGGNRWYVLGNRRGQ